MSAKKDSGQTLTSMNAGLKNHSEHSTRTTSLKNVLERVLKTLSLLLTKTMNSQIKSSSMDAENARLGSGTKTLLASTV